MEAPLNVNFLAQVVQLKHNLWTDKLKISTRSFAYALFWQTEHLGAALILNPRLGMVSAEPAVSNKIRINNTNYVLPRYKPPKLQGNRDQKHLPENNCLLFLHEKFNTL